MITAPLSLHRSLPTTSLPLPSNDLKTASPSTERVNGVRLGLSQAKGGGANVSSRADTVTRVQEQMDRREKPHIIQGELATRIAVPRAAAAVPSTVFQPNLSRLPMMHPARRRYY